MSYHVPVLLKPAVDLLAVKPGGIYVDATLGGGGHAREILRRSSPDGILIGIDRDPEALAAAGLSLAEFGNRLRTIAGNFSEMATLIRGCGLKTVDGVLFDLGASSAQIDRPYRGFSFQSSGPLDMRMDLKGPTAADLLNKWTSRDLARIILQYGQERRAQAIARAIIRARDRGRLSTTDDLRQAVLATRPALPQKTLARVFQALRLAVNQEIESLESGLEGAEVVLKPGGRLAVISYHSLEDGRVKSFFQKRQNPCTCPPRLACCLCGARPALKILTARPLRPDQEETAANPRARSARLRAAEKI